MSDAFNDLLDSDIMNEETRTAISEAWEVKLSAAKEAARGELREEFATKYEHDKINIVEALEKMVTEGISGHINELVEEKSSLSEDRVKYNLKMQESATKFNDFMVTKLADEIGELRKDRKIHNESIKKMEKFIVRALAEEISEFAQDKRDLVETKVRLVSEARGKLESLKTRFIEQSAKKLNESVTTHLKSELVQLHEDVKAARENDFGRKIFEAYAAEFSNTHMNSNIVMRDLRTQVEDKNRQLAEAAKIVQRSKTIAESKTKEVQMIKESNTRSDLMSELLLPLNETKREVMKNLLESVQTTRLKNAFEKYLPAVLQQQNSKKDQLTENVSEVTGNKLQQAQDVNTENLHNVIDIKRLAGIN